MKNLILFTSVLFFLMQMMAYGQTESKQTMPIKQDTILESQYLKSEINTKLFQNFIGKFLLVEGNFELEIVQENKQMFIISPFSKDLLIQKNETTLREPSRGVDLEAITNDTSGLKFTQNGYETIIKRVKPSTNN